MKYGVLLALITLSLANPLLAAETLSVVSPAAARFFSTRVTDIGTLLDDPAANSAVLKVFPELTRQEAQDGLAMARTMTFRSIAQFKPDVFTDNRLAALDTNLAKLSKQK